MFTRNNKAASAVVGVLVALAATGFAASPGSATYQVIADTVDAGGGQASSSAYKGTGTFGSFGGVSRNDTQVAKHGYAGQFYEVVGLTLGCANTNLNEAASCLLAARASLDDGTRINLSGGRVLWRRLSGPVAVDDSGQTSADFVYRNTQATLCGEYLGQTNVLTLLIWNVGLDDCGAYAGDGLADDWQVRFFGENNSAAVPAADPDGDGQNNSFEFAAGLSPNDAASRFSLSIESVPGQPAGKRVTFSPRFPDRDYSVQYCDNLAAGSFTTLVNSVETDSGFERTVLDLNATSPSRLYRIAITAP